MALIEKLSAIGQAIRDMTGKAEMLTLDDMPGEIRSIEGGGGSSADVRYVTFMSYDGTVEYGKKAVAVGDDCADPIARGIFETPTRESTAQYNYTFAGWATTVNGALDSNALKAVTEDRTVYANFISALRYYTITYYDGETVLKTESLAYGSMPSYTPVHDDYLFVEWNPTPVAVTGDASYTVVWKEKPRFATSTWAEIAEVAASGSAEQQYSVGDEKVITLKSGSKINCRIIGFNHDDLADGSGKAPISIALSNVYNLKVYSEKSGTDSNNTYLTSPIYDAISTTAWNDLPDDLKSVLKSVAKVAKKTSSVTENFNAKVWALSGTEVGATNTGIEGTAYTYYQGTVTELGTKRTMTMYNSSTTQRWWLRSGYNGYMNYVDTSGAVQSRTLTNTSAQYYIHFGFCI